MKSMFTDIYPHLGSALPHEARVYLEKVPPELVPETVDAIIGEFGLQNFLPDLARLEWASYALLKTDMPGLETVDRAVANPTLQLVELGWKNLQTHFSDDTQAIPPQKGPERIMLWREPLTGRHRIQVPTNEDLLALKIVVENISQEEAAIIGGVSVQEIGAVLKRSSRRGIILLPDTLIVRPARVYASSEIQENRFIKASTFVLQWHITQTCDLKCRHCYDRSERTHMSMEQATRVLDDLRSFCQQKNVQGHITFTGGNPLLYPHFTELYREAVERGFVTGILGNPAKRQQVEEIVDIQKPDFFQVSLEGLREYTDWMRGAGHFDRVMGFLDVLHDLDVHSMIMLTLTSGNISQVLPLARFLKGKVDSFNFNRLSQVGEGAHLSMPDRDDFKALLGSYLEAREKNPSLGRKDNLFNILLYEQEKEPFGGCTGYGCGAAFNFMALLPDGEVHACRKFPSPIGNAFTSSLEAIYDSPEAERYRGGTSACRECPIRPVCGGCMAITHSMQLDPFRDRDPFCFMQGV